MSNAYPWKFAKYLPAFIRAKLLRSKFEVSYDLPSAFSVKIAESKEEINQALRLIRQYPVSPFSKYDALPDTVILVAKWHDEVVGTLSLVYQSNTSLPSESIYSLKKFRDLHLNIAEISTLRMKKDFRLRRRKLVLPLCKMMHRYCTEVLKVDVIISNVEKENAAFYTDVLLFNKLESNGNLYYLALTAELLNLYKQTYNNKQRHKNLYHYFIEHKTSCIQFPEKNRRSGSAPRVELKMAAMAFVNGSKTAQTCSIVNISAQGLQIEFNQAPALINLGDAVVIVFEHDHEYIVCQASLKWRENKDLWGCQVFEKSYSWQKFTDTYWEESEILKAS